MPIKIVYYNAPADEWLEKKFSGFGEVSSASGNSKREFLIAMSAAVSECNVIVAIGGISSLVSTLSKGLGLPLAPVDWNLIGITSEDDAELPQGALPLIIGGSVYGMILESGNQCIIAMDSDDNAVRHLTDTYVIPYINAIAAGKASDADADSEASDPNPEAAQSDDSDKTDVTPAAAGDITSPVEDAATAAPEDDGENNTVVENVEAPSNQDGDSTDKDESETYRNGDENHDENSDSPEKDLIESGKAAPSSFDDVRTIKFIEEDEFNKNSEFDGDDEDGFDDLEDDSDLFSLDAPKKKHHIITKIICTVLALIILAGGGYAGYSYWWIPKICDDAYSEARTMYSKSSDASSMPANYLSRFGSLYKKNNDVIGWIKIDKLNINLPVVTEAKRSAGYYKTHLFNGSASSYGTPYIKHYYGDSSPNPNLVIYGANSKDGRMFSRIEMLLDKSTAKSIGKIQTDSVLNSYEKWQLFSVMILDATASNAEFNYSDNFSRLSAEQCSAQAKKALKLSKVDLGFTASDFENVSYSDNFLTLVTPYSKDASKVVVAMARMVVDNSLPNDSTSDSSDGTVSIIIDESAGEYPDYSSTAS